MKTNNIKSYLRSVVVVLLASTCVVGCQDEDVVDIHGAREPMNLQAEIHQQYITRVNDNGFADGDHIGVFVTNYSNGVAPELALTGNHADNVRFTFDYESGVWSGATQLYWKDKVTPIDAYGYYPFDDELSSVTAYPFIVQRNQRDQVQGEAIYGYEASDFLWAKAEGIVPTASAVTLRHKHIMAGIQVELIEGTGFLDGEWNEAEKQVVVENTHLGSTISLQAGVVDVDASSSVTSIIPQGGNGSYRAILVPQTIPANTTLFSITVNGQTHKFTRGSEMVYHPTKLHKFTIEVNYSLPTGDYQFNLIEEAVVAWENDAESHNGISREYVTVHVNEGEYIGDVIDSMGIDASVIKNLRITGTFTRHGQFTYIREHMLQLEAVNMRDLKLKLGNEDTDFQIEIGDEDYIPRGAFNCMQFLSHLVLPEKLKAVGIDAFNSCNLRGSLILPEGLIYVGIGSFANNKFTGELYIPTTIKWIDNRAFVNNYFQGELILPARMQFLANEAFGSCDFLTGKIHIPEGLVDVQTAWAPNMTGDVKIPQGVTKISGIGGRPTSIYIPEGVVELGPWALNRSSLKGDIHLPSTIQKIGSAAFEGSGISHINLPSGIEFIESNTFNRCKYLQDTIHIPSGVVQIKESAFAECEKLTAVILPAELQEIHALAFLNCRSLDYIRCLGTEPPFLASNAFNGVEKNNFTLVVPDGAVEAYRNADGWKEFKRISSYRNFVCRPMFAHLLNKSNTRTVILNADGNWKVAHCPDWVHPSVTSGYKKTELTVTIDELSHGAGNRSDSIVFTLDNQVDEDGNPITCYYSVVQFDSEYDEDGELLLQQATKGNGINIVFVGDGYDAENIADGSYVDDVEEGIEYFFSVEPYKTYREYFSVYIDFALSYESGVCSSVDIWRDTKFDTTYGAGEDGRLKVDINAITSYLVNDVENSVIVRENDSNVLAICLLNSDAYEGVCYQFDGAAVAVVPHSRYDYPNDYRGVIQHEACGHGFAKLGDEYIYHRDYIQKCSCTCCGHEDDLSFGHSVGRYRNLSLTGKYKHVEWSHLIFDDRYQDIVDIYEGGYFHGQGVYRSEVNSCMNNNVPYFSTWSRQIAVERIKALAGEQFDFEEFVANDSREWGDKFLTRSGGNGDASSAMHNPAPIVKKGSPLDYINKNDRRR